ncbi:hypothetical protein CS022_24575 [Veronia nyctiphanis]|uniref:Uncharacterized protein n=1 Tax=Veronia nyctiphanis TaxID=1278244 RepID=A0A4Q0YC45_9GAMM|nr:hypothetical protein CS022_24575 [Veronia nyctiphanis]
MLSSCAILYSGVVENHYAREISVTSINGVDETVMVQPSEKTEIPIFETESGTCMTVMHGSNVEHFSVPKPPVWAKISGIWDVKFSIEVSPSGAFYVGENRKRQKLKRVISCKI